MRSSAGISWRESPSERLQKFTNTTWPRNSDKRKLRPSNPRNTKSGASLPTMLGAAAGDDAAIAALRIRLPAINALRMRCNAQTDATASRFINHAGNPAVPDLILKNGPRTGSFAPLPFGEFALIRPYAKSHNASRSVNATAARSLGFCKTWRTFMHIHRSAGKAANANAKRAAKSCRHYKPTIECHVSGMRQENETGVRRLVGPQDECHF